MSNPNAAVAAREAKPVEKTPSYAWPCLITSVLAGIALVFAWQWLPGITFPVFKNWLAENNALFANPANFELMSNVMGLVPIGALIMALPASYLVRKIGPKAATVAGLALGAVGTAVSAVFVGDNFYAFLVGRFILGVALATTIVAGPTCVSVWFPDATRGRAMAIWSIWAPVGIFVINFIGNNVFEMAGSDMVAFQWIWVAVIVVFAVIFAIVFREPRENERSQVSPERKSFKEVLPFFKSRQLWCLILMFAIYNYVNYGFSQYLKTWMQTPELLGGLGWDAAAAGLWGGLICACGALAPIGGLILDKTPRDKKYLCVVVGILFLALASATFSQVTFFLPYVVFFLRRQHAAQCLLPPARADARVQGRRHGRGLRLVVPDAGPVRGPDVHELRHASVQRHADRRLQCGHRGQAGRARFRRHPGRLRPRHRTSGPGGRRRWYPRRPYACRVCARAREHRGHPTRLRREAL